MTSTEIWRARAMAWKESGQRSEDFSRGLGIDPGELRSWTSKLGLSKPRKKRRMKAMTILPRLARVEMRSKQGKQVEPVVFVQNSMRESGVSIRTGNRHVEVLTGFDAGTLRSVLAIIGELGQ